VGCHAKVRKKKEFNRNISWEVFKIKAIMVQNEPKESRNNTLAAALIIKGVSIRQLSRVTDVSINMIWRISNR